MEKVTNIEENMMVGETEVFVKEKKHPIRNFISNHPTITTIVVGVLAALGGYTVGNMVGGSEDDFDMDYDPDDVTPAVTEAVATE